MAPYFLILAFSGEDIGWSKTLDRATQRAKKELRDRRTVEGIRILRGYGDLEPRLVAIVTRSGVELKSNPRVKIVKRKSTVTKSRPAKSRRSASSTVGGVWSRLMRSSDAKYFLPLRKGRKNPLLRPMTIRKGSKTLKILPQAKGMVKATVKFGTKVLEAVFSSVEEALNWGMGKIGMRNPEQVKVIRAIRNGASAANPGGPWKTIAAIRAANNRIGRHWFSKDTMRFFKTKVYSTIYGGRYFITSDEELQAVPGYQHAQKVRVYKVREAEDNGEVNTASTLTFRTLSEARDWAKDVARRNPPRRRAVESRNRKKKVA